MTPRKEKALQAPLVSRTRGQKYYTRLSLCRRIKTPLWGLYGLTAAYTKHRIKQDAFQALRFALTATG